MSSEVAASDQLLRKIGAAIRRHRKARRWTQEQLAETAGLSTYFIGSVERGQAALSLRSVQQIADALGIPLAVFFEGELEDDRERLLTEVGARLRRASTEELRVFLDLVSVVVRDRA